MKSITTLEKILLDAEKGELPIEARVQITGLILGKTSGNKPYYDLEIADCSARAKLKIWSDTQAFQVLGGLSVGMAIGLDAIFSKNQWGLNASKPAVRTLSDEEREVLFAPSPARQEVLMREWNFIKSTVVGISDPRLKIVASDAITRYEAKWLRAAAARTYHHARRGGLIEHVAQMLRAALAITPLYPELSQDLLVAGVLFHDIGKLWENDFEAEGFTMPVTLTGELVGHITTGVEVINALWREAKARDEGIFTGGNPPADLLRQHLLHLVLSHHGSRDFGSPITPRTPEGWVLHHIDSLDAKIEMLRCAYAENKELAPGIFEQRRPLEGFPILPISLYGRTGKDEPANEPS